MDATARIIDAASADWSRFNRASFSFGHFLAKNELFQLPRLRTLAKRMLAEHGPNRVDCLVGDKGTGANWSDWKSNAAELDFCFDHMPEPAQSYVVIKQIQRDAEYGTFFNRVMGEFRETLIPELAEQMTWGSAYLFLAAPGFSTPYHIDHETGVLLQIHGSKALSLYYGTEPSLPTQHEREHYYMGNLDAAAYRADMLDQAITYNMSPGTGVHLPVNAPHWVKNGDEYSVSLSINFCLQPFDRAARVHQANHILRKFGLSPRPPGVSPVADRLKRIPIDVLSRKNPETMDEMLRSGVRRLNDMLVVGRAAARRVRMLGQEGKLDERPAQ